GAGPGVEMVLHVQIDPRDAHQAVDGGQVAAAADQHGVVEVARRTPGVDDVQLAGGAVDVDRIESDAELKGGEAVHVGRVVNDVATPGLRAVDAELRNATRGGGAGRPEDRAVGQALEAVAPQGHESAVGVLAVVNEQGGVPGAADVHRTLDRGQRT